MFDLPFGLPVFEQKPFTKALPGKTGPVVVVRSVEVKSLVLGRRFSEQLGVIRPAILPRQNSYFP